MPLSIYNTLTKKKELFTPLKEGEVGMYVCGVTVYDLCHIGHARAAIVFDVIYRYLKYIGFKVTYIRNFTDVDDKIIKKANEEGVSSEIIAERYIKEFYTDMDALGIERPTYEPKATGHIPEMIEMIKRLIEKGYAYQSNGDIFYSVRKFNEYGKLSGKNTDELLSGARVEVDEKKRDPLDFALWKASKPGEPWWESPWGKGRPGWHIECSAMGQKYLGHCFDIHGGGKDLVFPHHENEIAQSHAATGIPPVRYWVHNGFVNINKEKMSKSLGNFFTIKDVLKKFNPEVIRFFLLSSHYRSPIDFSDQNLNEAKINLDRFYDLFLFFEKIPLNPPFSKGEIKSSPPLEKGGEGGFEGELIRKFEDAMNDDFNTAQVIGYMNTELHRLNGMRNILEGSRVKGQGSRGEMQDVEFGNFLKGIAALKKIGEVFGLFSQNPTDYFEKEKAVGIQAIGITEDEIGRLITERESARREKRWADADSIRSELSRQGIIIEDTPQGAKWKVR
ncbi:MAG: cysteine--tRNA ligase [Nitrospinae bacterium]|nr:cysteine--tRNA ligase [Nitrospinota bacterium]